jgi:hypothetical protein
VLAFRHDYPRKLDQAGLAEPGSLYEYAQGKLVICVGLVALWLALSECKRERSLRRDFSSRLSAYPPSMYHSEIFKKQGDRAPVSGVYENSSNLGPVAGLRIRRSGSFGC